MHTFIDNKPQINVIMCKSDYIQKLVLLFHIAD